MSYGSQGVRTTDVTQNQAALEIIAPAAADVHVRSIEIIQAAAAAQSLGLGRPAAKGVTPTTPALFQKDGSGAALATSSALAWGTSPTAPSIYIRRWNSPAALGASVRWDFPGRGLLVPAGTTLVIFNITTGQVSDVNVAIDE